MSLKDFAAKYGLTVEQLAIAFIIVGETSFEDALTKIESIREGLGELQYDAPNADEMALNASLKAELGNVADGESRLAEMLAAA